MRSIVISHFFNEEYLLPWWLSHHRDLFDHGVLIDYHSTDRSVEICRDLVPRWDVVTSENSHFSGILCDFEVMKHEQRFADCWKIALNTTEFLVAPKLEEMQRLVLANDMTGIRLPGAIMVDGAPGNPPDRDRPLTEQKRTGIWESAFDFRAIQIPGLTFPTRNRLYHRFDIGAYLPGRHGSHLPGQVTGSAEFASIWWYAFSPWTDEFKRRKLGIDAKRAGFDRKHRMGVQHEASTAELDLRWSHLFPFATDLTQKSGASAVSPPVRSEPELAT